MANYSRSLTVSGLGATTITVPTTDRYDIDGKITLPTLQAGEAKSAIVVTIAITSQGTVYTGDAGARGFHIQPFCNANDVITITLSSSSNSDKGLNTVKTTIAVSEGV